jgi:serine/threonine-protein kinase
MAANAPDGERFVCNGRYRVLERIGTGATADVHVAEDTKANNMRVAIKFLKPHLTEDDDVVRRFLREPDIASTVDSPYVARLLNHGKDRHDRLWIVFELLSGRTLDRALREDGPFHFGDVAWIMEDALRGVIAIHEKGIIHRDLKPGNILIEELADGTLRARVLDFGISKLWARKPDGKEHSVLTVLESILGTPNYMPPEQLADPTQVTVQADIYALGGVFFRALTGQLPFVGNTPEAVLDWKRRFPLLRLRDVTHEKWPEVLEAFLERAMARDPTQRFSSASAMLDELLVITPIVLRELRAKTDAADDQSPRVGDETTNDRNR